MHRRIVVSLPIDDFKRLRDWAEREDRQPQQQAAHVLRQEISRAAREPSAESDPQREVAAGQ